MNNQELMTIGLLSSNHAPFLSVEIISYIVIFVWNLYSLWRHRESADHPKAWFTFVRAALVPCRQHPWPQCLNTSCLSEQWVMPDSRFQAQHGRSRCTVRKKQNQTMLPQLSTLLNFFNLEKLLTRPSRYLLQIAIAIESEDTVTWLYHKLNLQDKKWRDL